MKKGFTLVELLAVIAILAILVIIALPNVMGMFNQAKKNSFTTEIKEVYKIAQQTWMSDSMFNTGDRSYARSRSGCPNGLDLSGREELEYYIKINKAGNVVEYYASDGTYQYQYKGNGLKIEDIQNVAQISEIDEDSEVIISCSGNDNPNSGDIKYPSGKNINTVTLGDIITIKGQEFHVMENTSSYLKVLARYNLNVGPYKNESVEEGIQHSSIKGYIPDITNYGVIAFSSTNYWFDKVGEGKTYPGEYCNYNFGSNCAYVEDSNSIIHPYLITYLNWLGINNAEIKLLSVQEAEALGCVRQLNNDMGSCNNAPDWVHSTTYWLGSPITAIAPWIINGRTAEYNFGASNSYRIDTTYGIRPVLIISK